MLTREEARSFYDRFGRRQEWQRVYEGRAIRHLLKHGMFDEAHAVIEFGCGTGLFAEDLLERRLPVTATYVGFDISPTMVSLARRRLQKFAHRAAVHLTDGSPKLPVQGLHYDRFVANYVLDLLPAEEITAVLKEAHRVLVPGGRLCLLSLTYGVTPLSRLVGWLWRQAHALRPSLVGGCRPLRLLEFLSTGEWHTLQREVVVGLGLPSEVVVAEGITNLGEERAA